MKRVAAAVGFVASLAALALTIIGLHALGHGMLALPHGYSGAAVGRWLDQRSGPTVAFAVLRLIAIAAAGYLLLALSIGAVARASRIPHLVAATDLLTVTPIRGLLNFVVGAGMAVSLSALAAAPVSATGTRVAVAISVPAPPTTAATATMSVSTQPHATPGSTATMSVTAPATTVKRSSNRAATTVTMSVAGTEPRSPRNKPAPAAARTTPQVRPVRAVPRMATAPPVSTTAPAASPVELVNEWTVVPGDSFWSKAHSLLIAAGVQPSDRQVADYSATLIAHNRSRLADPDNPDLILPGQRFELPPLNP